MIVERATVEHFRRLTVQPHQRIHLGLLDEPDYLRDLLELGALAASDGERTLIVAGILDKGGGRGEPWAWLAADLKREMLGVTRLSRNYLAASPFRRLEFCTDPRLPECTRWARALGFKLEAVLQSWCSDGGSAFMWARVR